MTDTTPTAGGPQSVDNRNIMIVLSYLWLLALVPLLTEKDDKVVQWHAKHGIVLMVAEIIVIVGISFVGTILAAVTWLLSLPFTGVLLLAAQAGILVLHILCIVKGVGGGRLEVPYISAYADRL